MGLFGNDVADNRGVTLRALVQTDARQFSHPRQGAVRANQQSRPEHPSLVGRDDNFFVIALTLSNRQTIVHLSILLLLELFMESRSDSFVFNDVPEVTQPGIGSRKKDTAGTAFIPGFDIFNW